MKTIELSLKKRVRRIWSDNGTELMNQFLDGFLQDKGITNNFSTPYTPQQNKVVDRRNQSLYEASTFDNIFYSNLFFYPSPI